MSETLIYFGIQTLKMNGYNHFNLNTLNILDISNMFYAIIFDLFTPFNTFSLQCQFKNLFDISTKFDVIGLNELHSFIFKVYNPKCIKVLKFND